jgi:hypothetical protein
MRSWKTEAELILSSVQTVMRIVDDEASNVYSRPLLTYAEHRPSVDKLVNVDK